MKAEVIESGLVAGEPREKGQVLELTEREFACGVRRGRVKAFSEPVKKATKKVAKKATKKVKVKSDILD